MSSWLPWPDHSPCPFKGEVEVRFNEKGFRSCRPAHHILTEADPNGLDPHAPGAKLDAGKLLPWLCVAGFANALSAVAEVTTKGARKYTPNGWAKVENGEERYMEAFGRHMFKLGQGERVDIDTQCLHKAQMIWNLLASLELELREQSNTRYTPTCLPPP